MSESNLPANFQAPIDARRPPSVRDADLKLQLQKTTFSGPLPPPGVLEAYERVSPGLSDRIVKMAESSVAHHQSMMQQVIELEGKDMEAGHLGARRGQFCALIVVLASLAGGAYIASLGHEIAASAFGMTGMTSVVLAFLADRRNLNSVESKKSPDPASTTQPSRRSRKKS